MADANGSFFATGAAEPSSGAGNETDVDYEQCRSLLERSHSEARTTYGYLVALVCPIGLVVNLFTIVVLTRKSMVTPVNALLTALAVADSCLLAVQFPLSIMFYVTAEISGSAGGVHFSTGRAPVTYWHVASAVTLLCRTVAVWEAVAVAAFRYVCVRHPTAGKRLCTVRNAGLVTVAVVIVSVATQLPGWMLYEVVPADSVPYTSFPYCLEEGGEAALAAAEGRLFTLRFTNSTSQVDLLAAVNSWLFAVAVKLAPPALLAVFTTLLFVTMCRAEARRKSLVRAGRSEASRRAREHNLATAALFTVVALHLLVELPQGVVLLVAQIVPSVVPVYESLGDFMNAATLIAMSVNFFIYTTMMGAFRRTVKDAVFCRLGKPGGSAGGGGGAETHSTYGESTVFIASTRNGKKQQGVVRLEPSG